MIIHSKVKTLPDQSFVKVVVDLDKHIISLGCDLHIDCADELAEEGSDRKNLWGANIYPNDKKIEFVSLINIRPADNNRSMEITVPEIRRQTEEIIKKLLF